MAFGFSRCACRAVFVFVAGLMSGNAFLGALIPTGCEEKRQAHEGIGRDKASKLRGWCNYTCFSQVYIPLSQTILWSHFVPLGRPELIRTVVRLGGMKIWEGPSEPFDKGMSQCLWGMNVGRGRAHSFLP